MRRRPWHPLAPVADALHNFVQPPLTAIDRAPKKSFRAGDQPTYNADKFMRTHAIEPSRTDQQDRQVPAAGRGSLCCG